MILQWMIPEMSAVEKVGGGKRKKILDLFGKWRGLESVTLDEAINLEIFDFDDEGYIPFAVFDMLRSKHGIDVTAISMSFDKR